MASNDAESVVENDNKQATSIIGIIGKIYRNITVEPLIICWLLPFLMTYAAIENMNLEKACRALVVPEKGFDKDVCKLFVRKDQFDITCQDNNGTYKFDDVKNDKIKAKYGDLYSSIEDKLPEVYEFLCKIEDPVQQKISFVNSIRNPISSIGPLIIILFAGPWSDKKKLRVPCMLVPYIGEVVGYLSLFIAAIFINGPMEFPAYAYRLIPSLTGAENLMVMGIYSYLTAVSSEENRTLRFGMFQILLTIIPIIAQALSTTLIKLFDYTELFGAMIPIHIIGFLYAIFYLKEPARDKDDKEEAAYDNQAMEMTSTSAINSNSDQVNTVKHKNAILEFFDPQHAIDCIKTFIKKRQHGVRMIIVLLMLLHWLLHGVIQGETQNIFLYGRYKLNWDVDTYIYHNIFTIVLGLIGTLLAVGVLSKLLKVVDIILVIMSTFLSIICRAVYIFATTNIMFFAGTAVDFMSTVKFLGARSIVSKIVPTEDLSTMFALMGLFEGLAAFVFSYAYPTLYQFLLDDKNYDISIMFILSGILYIIGLVFYIFLWKLLGRKEKSEASEEHDTKL